LIANAAKQAPAENLLTMGSNPDEDGSFTDGWAVYSRFFKPGGLTIRKDAYTIWVADIGNNKIRNITCSGTIGSTFEPTYEPTYLPTSAPVPTVPKNPKLKAPGKGPKATKVKKGPKFVAVSLLSSNLSNVAESISNLNSVVVAFAAAGFAGLLVSVLFYRKKLMASIGL